MGVTRVEVEIQELALRGFGRIDGAKVAESLEATLGSLLSSGDGDLGKTRAVDSVEAPAIELPAGASPRALGRAIAERVHESVRR